MSAVVSPLMTIADLDSMPDDGNRYELIEGELIVSCAPNLIHQFILRNATVLLDVFLQANPVGVVAPGPGVIFDDYNGVIPDLVFLSNERRDEIASGTRVMGAPDLVIEIISPGAENVRRDRIAKRQVYSRFGVREYWIIDADNRAVEVYKLTELGLEPVATLIGKEVLTSGLLPGFACEVDRFFRF
jgi:Uma2 family endonuclease